MEHLDEQDAVRLKALLRHTGEFIAYFELAETKMMEWQHHIDQKAQAQQAQFQQQLQSLQVELGALQEIMTTAGITRFRQAADKSLQQGQEYLIAMQDTKTHVLKELTNHKATLNQLAEEAIMKLSDHTAQSITSIDKQLAKYDPQHFFRITNDSCEQVKKSANNAISISHKLLHLFQWRAIALTFATSLLTAFAIGLYISDEYPWEIHQHAMNERGAGKLLIDAWPKLSYQEKVKIIGEQGKKNG